MDSIGDRKTMIADIGHWKTKASFSGDENPKTEFHSLVGEPKFTKFIKTTEDHNYIVDPSKDIIDMYYVQPVLENGIITERFRLKELINHLQTENKSTKSNDFGYFFSEPLFAVEKQKKEIAQIVLEEFKSPSIAFYPQPLISLFSKGNTNGMMIEVGHGMIQVAAICNGFRVSDSFKREDTGGHSIDSFLKNILETKGYSIPKDFLNNRIDLNNIKKQNISCMKKKEAAVYNNWNHRSMSNGEIPKTLELNLPDGNKMEVDDFSNDIGELLFRPEMNDLPYRSIQDLVFDAFSSVDIYSQKFLKDKIFVSGGTSKMPNLVERLSEELNDLQANKLTGNVSKSTSENNFLDIKSVSNPTHSVFIGATVICNSSAGSLFISNKDYKEIGEHSLFNRFN